MFNKNGGKPMENHKLTEHDSEVIRLCLGGTKPPESVTVISWERVQDSSPNRIHVLSDMSL